MTITEELAQRQLDAYNNRNIESFVACYSPEVQLLRLQSQNTFCKGRDQMREIYGQMFREKVNLHCKLVNRIVCGEIAIDEERVQGLMEDAELHAVAIYEVRDGLIQRAWFAREM